jgi:hypothetical protein
MVFASPNDEELKHFLDNKDFRGLLLGQPSIHIEIHNQVDSYTGDFPPGTGELYLRVSGAVKDPIRLKALLHLASAILERLASPR